MYPQVTQFETRQRLLLDELQLQEERLLARLPNTTPQTARWWRPRPLGFRTPRAVAQRLRATSSQS